MIRGRCLSCFNSWFWRLALLQPDGKLQEIPTTFAGDLYPAGWSKGDKILGMGYSLRSELWQMRLSQAVSRPLPPAR